MAKEDKLANLPQTSLAKSLHALWSRVTKRRRIQFILLLILTIAASVFEVISLGLLVPFLALLAAPLGGEAHPAINYLMNLTGVRDTASLAFFSLIAFCSAALVSGVFRLFVLYANNRFSFSLATEIGQDIYLKALHQPYIVHLATNSSLLVDAAANKSTMVAANVVGQILNLATSSFVGISIILTIMATDLRIALTVAGLFSVLYGIVILATRSALRRNGAIARRQSAQGIKALQEGIGGIRDVIIEGTQQAHVDIFRSADRPYKMALARNALIAGAPRFLVETAGMVLIAAVGFSFSREGNIASAIPTLGVLALGAQRLLPMLQQGYSAIATIRGNGPVLEEVISYLEQNLPHGSPQQRSLTFDNCLELRNVGFSYSAGKAPILEHINIEVAKGASIGLYGATGGGKSTILDITMGLLEPTSGGLFVDGVQVTSSSQPAWRRHVAHVPQAIFLSDSTIAENIAFGTPSIRIDMEKVRWAAELAQLSKSIESWSDRYETMVGERGVRLSGGQKQRIGIARALYKGADVIILDEATSALDSNTEQTVISAIERLDPRPTIIMVAHRLSTLRNCDSLYEIAEGKIVRQGSYDTLIGNKFSNPEN